ncbi:DcrB-related protein [Siccibacter colletis]|uniref:DcrB-related protein n=1 Tax=Siccibacter colletis TaxID=1505757 RepID=UPI0028BE0315|nr:DcrB-related protein [Siccibacter colletis]WNN47926.1 DcrB-related protein [Siccibacter colletis]
MGQNDLTYSLLEGTFITEAPLLDRTVNILMFRDPEDNEYSIMINRALLDEDQTPEAWCEQQTEIQRNQLPGFKPEGKMLTHEIGPARLPVIQIANSFLQDGKTVRQVQSIIRLPRHRIANPVTRGLIIFTLRSESEFTEHQRKHYVQVINSFNPEATLP